MKIKFLNSVRVRLVIAIITMVSIPFAILQVANVLLIYDKLQTKTEYTTEALAHSIATNLQEFMQGVFDSSSLLAQNSEVVGGTPEGQAILQNAITQMPYYKLIYGQGMDGMQTIRTSGELVNRSDRWWFKRMVQDPSPFVSEAYVSVNNNELVSSIFLPMYSGSDCTGIFGADFTLNTIQQAATPYLNSDISFLILDSRGSVLAGTDYQSGEYINYIDYTKRTVMLDENGNYRLDSAGNIMTQVEKIEVSDTMKRIISGALGSKTASFKFRDSRNDIVVCAYQPIALPGKSDPWSVIVFQKQTDNLSIVALVGMFALLILCCIVITLHLINRNILRPVLLIQRGMASIAAGQLEVKLDETEQNEIGALAADINKMTYALRQHQQRIDENEKMVSLGNLVAGVAHEINTPLGIGVTTSSYMKKVNTDSRRALNEGRFTKDALVNYMETMDESLDLLDYNLNRGSTIIQSFKQIAVDLTYEAQEEFNVLQHINNVVISLTHEYKKSNHTFHITCDENLEIKSYPGAFAQIFTNLIMNSIIHGFHGKENGQIDIEALMQDDTFVLRYGDNGCGISPENLEKIFAPFFTTRKNLGGSGLGLNIVHNLVTKKLNGTIAVESQLGLGTVFTIRIPKGD